MRVTEVSDKKPTRRVASRIYEQANLFYHKLEPSLPIKPESSFESVLTDFASTRSARHENVESVFPESQSQENDTLNVNVSASGIAFTCKEELKAGDYLMLRILLLSSMTVITTCCNVVYCNPSNPYETNRYPFSVGAQFVNMAPEERELLSKHVSRRRKQQWSIQGLIAALILAILAAPDQALALLVSLGHYLLEIVLHVLHLGFEYLEMGLDHVIEHLFHTGTHETQVIVFYVLVSFALVILYFLWRLMPPACARLRDRLLLFWSRKTASARYFWSQQSMQDKIKIVGISAAAVAGYLYLAV